MISSLTVNGVKALSLMQKLMMLMIIQMGILMGIPCHIPSSHLRLNICIGSFSFILVCLTYPYLATIFVLAAISFCCLVPGTRVFCSPNIVQVLWNCCLCFSLRCFIITLTTYDAIAIVIVVYGALETSLLFRLLFLEEFMLFVVVFHACHSFWWHNSGRRWM
jgi:hypothetical protein